MDKPWTSHGQAATGAGALCQKQQVDRPFLERTTGFEPATPPWQKGATSVHRRSPPFVLAGQGTESALADTNGPVRTDANEANWGQVWGPRGGAGQLVTLSPDGHQVTCRSCC